VRGQCGGAFAPHGGELLRRPWRYKHARVAAELVEHLNRRDAENIVVDLDRRLRPETRGLDHRLRGGHGIDEYQFKASVLLPTFCCRPTGKLQDLGRYRGRCPPCPLHQSRLRLFTRSETASA